MEQEDDNKTPVETAPSSPYSRHTSVSEAAEHSGKVWNAPRWLSWIEIPFHVPDPNTGRKLPEAAGWAMDSVGRGPLNQVGSYVGSAILRLATIDAGCRNPLTCTKTVYGFRPSSLLTATTSIIGVIAAILMPIVGAVVDHTRYRRLIGALSGFLSVALIGAQIFISQDTWFFMLIIDAIQTFVYLVHTTSVFAYLPDLSLDRDVTAHYTSRFNLRQYLGQFCYVLLVIWAGEQRNIQHPIDSSVQTARDAAGMAFAIGTIFIGYSWTFLFRERPALSEVPEGSTLATTGFVRIAKTTKKVWKDYRALKWFMISLLFSPEAGAGVILSIAVTFLIVFMGFSGLDIAKTSLVLMCGNILGSLWSKRANILINPLNSYRCGMLMLGAGIGTSVLVMEPDRRESVFGFAAWWGFSMGWAYPSQRVLFVTLIPKGQETEFMGLFVFMGQILGWLPSLIYTIINENGVDIRWGLGLVFFFCLTAIILTLPMGDYDEAVRLVASDSEEKLKAVIAATSNNNVTFDGVVEQQTTLEVDSQENSQDADVEAAPNADSEQKGAEGTR